MARRLHLCDQLHSVVVAEIVATIDNECGYERDVVLVQVSQDVLDLRHFFPHVAAMFADQQQQVDAWGTIKDVMSDGGHGLPHADSRAAIVAPESVKDLDLELKSMMDEGLLSLTDSSDNWCDCFSFKQILLKDVVKYPSFAHAHSTQY